MEPQNWKSYKKNARICETTKAHYQNIQFKPHEFKEWLLSEKGGFKSCHMLFPPRATPGFSRTIFVFTK